MDAGDAAMTHTILLTPDITGWIDRSVTGSTHIQGRWSTHGDGNGADGTTATGDCERNGHPVSDCSQIAPPPGGGVLNTDGVMCTSGIAAKVVPIPPADAGPLDYNNIWGAEIGIDFYAQDGLAPAPYNASANGVLGIAFDIDMVPSTNLRVEFPTRTAINPAFWDGDQPYSPVRNGHNEVRWSAVTGPFYDVLAPPFDPTTILSVQFHVPPSGLAAAPFSFCIRNLAAIVP
jgi:hypothetical protein